MTIYNVNSYNYKFNILKIFNSIFIYSNNYDSLSKQIEWIEEYIKANQIESYEQIIESEIHKSTLIFKFIILQKSINRESKDFLKRYYNIKFDKC